MIDEWKGANQVINDILVIENSKEIEESRLYWQNKQDILGVYICLLGSPKGRIAVTPLYDSVCKEIGRKPNVRTRYADLMIAHLLYTWEGFEESYDLVPLDIRLELQDMHKFCGYIRHQEEEVTETPTNQEKEKETMKLTIETRTFVNGTDVATFKEDRIIRYINDMNTYIETLEKVEPRPRTIDDAIIKAKQELSDFVQVLDDLRQGRL